jgi:DNA-binding NtrC family response regulator
MAKILVIDDEATIRWAIEQTLRTAGHEVAVAETAAEGLTLFRQTRPDVVFLDIRLPDQNGLVVLKEIEDEPGQETAVIVMSAFGEGTCTEEQALALGAQSCLNKPFRFDELDAVVADALDAKRLCSHARH